MGLDRPTASTEPAKAPRLQCQVEGFREHRAPSENQARIVGCVLESAPVMRRAHFQNKKTTETFASRSSAL